MIRISASVRIVVGLLLLVLSMMLVGRTLGLGPNERQAVLNGRARLCENIALNASICATRDGETGINASLRAAVSHNPDILSAAIRRPDGTLLVEIGNHQSHGNALGTKAGIGSELHVPIVSGKATWGNLEIRFRPLDRPGFAGLFANPSVQLMAFVVAGCFVPFWIFLKKSLRHLDPSKVVPSRVREALDTLAGGLLVIDKEDRIVLANKAFSESLGKTSTELQGYHASELPWYQKSHDSGEECYPWLRALQDKVTQTGSLLGLKISPTEQRSYLVNSTPILATDGCNKGVLASFQDVTELERKKFELSQMLEVLQHSREQIRRKNEELQVLATQDPLTTCLNRRSFYEQAETHWDNATRNELPLSCIMLDIDHFKSINDSYGHSVGDAVLTKIATQLQSVIRDGDILCRYGGEEFCILLPNLTIEEAVQAADRFRKSVATVQIEHVTVTASFGVSSNRLGANSPQAMLDEADKCLYFSKRNGRNQVSSWDQVCEQTDFRDEQQPENEHRHRSSDDLENGLPSIANRHGEGFEVTIPFHAVSALTSALAYRDEGTAEHSRRVADLCVAVADRVMSVGDAYVLEVAALLHDIGKIGVPDAILLKPGPLTPEEWKVMGIHDRIGVEIVSSTFASESLLEIIETHHAFFGGQARDPNLVSGFEIPLGARILAVADAYDAMVSDRVYRKGVSREEAFAELRRCSGTQFDPELVDRFIEVVESRDEFRRPELKAVSKQTALRLGEQMERLARALDNQDLPGLATLAGRVNSTASKQGVSEIAQIAAQLQTAACDMDLTDAVRLTSELLELCRSAQKVHLDCIEPNESEEPELARL